MKKYILNNKKIAELYQNGTLVLQIAEIFNVCKKTIYNKLHENGIEVNTGGFQSGHSKSNFKQPWNKGLKIDYKKYPSWGMKNKNFSEKTKKIWSIIRKGKKPSLTTREKMSETQKRIGNIPPHPKGKDCHFWKGGVTPLRQLVRTSFKYRLWRSDVFTRDDYICQNCGKKGGNINAHHIKQFALIMDENNIETFEQAVNCEELWNINNGITLCEECHKPKKGK